MDWQVKTAEGKLYDRSTPGPWELSYSDGSALTKNEHNIGADGKSFSYRSPGPWKVTNIDGYVETLKADSSEIDVEHIAGHSNWRDFVSQPETKQTADGVTRKPRAFPLSASDTSPISLSTIPRVISMENTSKSV